VVALSRLRSPDGALSGFVQILSLLAASPTLRSWLRPLAALGEQETLDLAVLVWGGVVGGGTGGGRSLRGAAPMVAVAWRSRPWPRVRSRRVDALIEGPVPWRS